MSAILDNPAAVRRLLDAIEAQEALERMTGKRAGIVPQSQKDEFRLGQFRDVAILNRDSKMAALAVPGELDLWEMWRRSDTATREAFKAIFTDIHSTLTSGDGIGCKPAGAGHGGGDIEGGSND